MKNNYYKITRSSIDGRRYYFVVNKIDYDENGDIVDMNVDIYDPIGRMLYDNKNKQDLTFVSFDDLLKARTIMPVSQETSALKTKTKRKREIRLRRLDPEERDEKRQRLTIGGKKKKPKSKTKKLFRK